MLAGILPSSGSQLICLQPQKYQKFLGRRPSIPDSCTRLESNASSSCGGVPDQGVQFPGKNRKLLRKVSSWNASPQCRAGSAGDSKILMTANNLEPSPEALALWRSADAVCFDVDSTVCTDEGIDELAAYCGAGEAVAAWTTRAMTGSVPFQDALAARLELINPSAADLAGFLGDHPPQLSPGIKDLVEGLIARGTAVYLISGGFRQMIEPVAALLHIHPTRIFANRILFNAEGGYGGFDDKEPTSRSGGKAAAIATLKELHGYEQLVMVGDGATDLEARMPGGADLFIGYGGVQVRPKVAREADWFVYSFDDVMNAWNPLS